MSKDVEQEIARLDQLNAELAESLQHCREVLNQWRPHLAANNNDARVADPVGKGDERRA